VPAIVNFGELNYTTDGLINQLYNRALFVLQDEYQTGYQLLRDRLGHPVQEDNEAMSYFTVQAGQIGATVLGQLAGAAESPLADTPYSYLAGKEDAASQLLLDIESTIRTKMAHIRDAAVQGTFRLEPLPGAPAVADSLAPPILGLDPKLQAEIARTWGTEQISLDSWMFDAFKSLTRYEFEAAAYNTPGIEVSPLASASIIAPEYEKYLDKLRQYFGSGQRVTYNEVARDMDGIFEGALARLSFAWQIELNRQENLPAEEIDTGRYADIRNKVYSAAQDMAKRGLLEVVRFTEGENTTPEEDAKAASEARLPWWTPDPAAEQARQDAKMRSYLRRDAIYMVDLPMTCDEIKDSIEYLTQYSAYVPVRIPAAGVRQGEGFAGWLNETPISKLFRGITGIVDENLFRGERVDTSMLAARQEFEQVYQTLFQYQLAFCKEVPVVPHIFPIRSTIRDAQRSTSGVLGTTYAKAALHDTVDIAWSEAERGALLPEGVASWVDLLLRSGQYADDLEAQAATLRANIHAQLDLFATDPWAGPKLRAPDGDYLPYTAFFEGEKLFQFWINRQVREAFRELDAVSTKGAGEVMRAPYASDFQMQQSLPEAMQGPYAEAMKNVFNLDLTGKGGERTDVPGYYIPTANTLFALIDWLREDAFDQGLAAFGDSMWKSVKDEEFDYFRTFVLSLEGREFVDAKTMYETLVMAELNRAITRASDRILKMISLDNGPANSIGLVYYGKVIPESGERVLGTTSGATATVYRLDRHIGGEEVGNIGGTLWVQGVHGTFGNEPLSLPDRASDQPAGAVTNGFPGVVRDLEIIMETNGVATLAAEDIQKAVGALQSYQPFIPTDVKSRERFETIFSAYWVRMMKVSNSTIGLDDDVSAAAWASAEASVLSMRYSELIKLARLLPGLAGSAAFAAGYFDSAVRGLGAYVAKRGQSTVLEIAEYRRAAVVAAEAPLRQWEATSLPQINAALDRVLAALGDAVSGKAPVSSSDWYIATMAGTMIIPGNIGNQEVSEKCREIARILNQNANVIRETATPQQANQATDSVVPSAATGELEAQEAVEKDPVNLSGAMFSPFVKFNGMRPKFAFHVEDFEPATLEPMLAEFARPRLEGGLRIETKCHGFRGSIQCRNGVVRVYLEGDYRDNSDLYPEIVKAVAEGPDVTLEAEFMESVAGVLAARPEGKFSPGQIDRARAVAVVFDILSLEKQHLADSPLYERLNALQRYFMDVMSDVIVPMAGVWCNTEPELLEAIKTLANAAGGEGVMIKSRNGLYTTAHETEDWAKVKARMRISALVLKVNKLKTGGVSYTCGVLRDNEATLRAEDAITYRGQKYVVLGATFATPVVAGVGDTIEVAVTELLRSEDERGREVFRWEDPRVIDVIDRVPDGLGRAIQIGAILQASISEPYRRIQEARWGILAATTSTQVLAIKTDINEILDQVGNERIRGFAEAALALAGERLGQVPGSTLGDIGYGFAIESGNEQMLVELDRVLVALQDGMETQPGEVYAQLRQLQAVVNSYLTRINQKDRPILFYNYQLLRDRVDAEVARLADIGAIDPGSIEKKLGGFESRVDMIVRAIAGIAVFGDVAAIEKLAIEAAAIRSELDTFVGGIGVWVCLYRVPERVQQMQHKLDGVLAERENAAGTYLSFGATTDKIVEAKLLLDQSADAMTKIKTMMDQVNLIATAPDVIGKPEDLGIGAPGDLGISFTAPTRGFSVQDVKTEWERQLVFTKQPGTVSSTLERLRSGGEFGGLTISPAQLMTYEPWIVWLISVAESLIEQWTAMWDLLLRAEAGQARLGGAVRIKASETVDLASVKDAFMAFLPEPTIGQGIERPAAQILDYYRSPSNNILPGDALPWADLREADIRNRLDQNFTLRVAFNEYLLGAGDAATTDAALADPKVQSALREIVAAADRAIADRIAAAWTLDTNPLPIGYEGVLPAEAEWVDPGMLGVWRTRVEGSPYKDEIISLLEQGNRILLGSVSPFAVLAAVNMETGDVTGDQNVLVDLTWKQISSALHGEPTVQRAMDGIGRVDRSQFEENAEAVKASLRGVVSTVGGCNGAYVGAGIAGNRVFVTAAHCAGDVGTRAELFAITGERIVGRVAWTGKGERGPAGLGQDIAVIVVEDAAEISKTSQMVELKIGYEYPQTAIVVAPNFGEADVIFRTTGAIALNPSGTHVATLKQSLDAGLAEYDLYAGYDRARSGYSGSPIIDSQGRVVGLWSGRLGEVYGKTINQRYGRAVPLDVIRAAIEAAGESVPAINLLPEAERTTLTASQTPPFTATGEMTGKLVRYKDKGWQGLEFGDLGFTIISDGAGDEGKFLEYRKDARLPAMKDFRAEGEKEELDTVRLLPSWIRNQPDDYYAEFYLSFDSHKELNGLWAYSAEAAQDYDAPGFLFRMNDESAFWLRKDSAHRSERSKLTDAERPSLQRIAQFLGRPPVIPAKKAS
jgi:hypothetical protein